MKEMYDAVYGKWIDESNPLGFEDSLLAMKAYGPYHQLYAMSAIICAINNMVDLVPNAATALRQMRDKNLLENVIVLAGNVLNSAYQNAAEEHKENGKIFVPPNWIKNKQSLKAIKMAIKTQLSVMKSLPAGKDYVKALYEGLTMDKESFESRWSAD